MLARRGDGTKSRGLRAPHRVCKGEGFMPEREDRKIRPSGCLSGTRNIFPSTVPGGHAGKPEAVSLSFSLTGWEDWPPGPVPLTCDLTEAG